MSLLPLSLLALPIPVLLPLTLTLLLLLAPLPLPLLMLSLRSAAEASVLLVSANLHAHLTSLRHLSLALAILATVPTLMMKPTSNMRSNAWAIARLFGFLLLLSFAVMPSSSAKNLSPCIVGTVIDPDGATIKGARVLVTNQKTELVYKTQTSPDGTYGFSKLPNGIYSLSVQVPGFQTFTVYGITLLIDSEYSRQVQMLRGMTSAILVPAGDQAKHKPDELAVRSLPPHFSRRCPQIR